MCSYILPVIIHWMLLFGKARCMRLPPTAGAGAGAGMITSSEHAHDFATSDPTVGPPLGEDASGASGVAASKDDQLSKTAGFEPHPDAPPGLMWAYRKPRHQLWWIAYELVLPLLVISLGCFFSVCTLVLLFQVGEGCWVAGFWVAGYVGGTYAGCCVLILQHSWMPGRMLGREGGGERTGRSVGFAGRLPR